ncbi:hypothetical protein MMC25_002603 [Agyrium rufum]|nr:hypothetical protein [Agyrium rufum]
MPPKRMTANPTKPARYRPGKPTAEERSSDDDEASEDDQDEHQAPAEEPRPKAARDPNRIASNLSKVDLNARRRQAALEEAQRKEAEKVLRAQEEEGFETEESDALGSGDEDDEEEGRSGSGESEGEEEEEEEEDSSSSDDEPKPVLLRPTFIKKDKRNGANASVTDPSNSTTTTTTTARDDTPTTTAAQEEARRKTAAQDEMLQSQIEKQAAAKAAGKKNWDDDEPTAGPDGTGLIDDTDALDPSAEHAAWKLRELTRVKRERLAIEASEKDREEIERRRNLTVEERDAEDKVYIEKQKEEQGERGKMGYLQKYHHKGAFYQDDAREQGLDRRDIIGSRFQDEVRNREALPEYMQIRDMARLGRKGRTKYKDLKSEDTGRWGVEVGGRGRGGYLGGGGGRGGGAVGRVFGVDERFQPDRDGGRGTQGPSGANATVVKERRERAPEGAPGGPRGVDKQERRDTDKPERRDDDGAEKEREIDRRRDQRNRDGRDRGDSYIPTRRSRSPDPRRHRRRGDSYSRSRTPPSRRDRTGEHYDRDRRKRSPSPHGDRYRDKRQRLEGGR